jgi:hypothetical protein
MLTTPSRSLATKVLQGFSTLMYQQMIEGSHKEKLKEKNDIEGV